MDNRESIRSDLLLRFLAGVFFIGAFVVFTAISAIFGPRIESFVFPVVEDISFQYIEDNDEKTVVLHVVGEKVRMCRFLDVSALVLKDGIWMLGQIDIRRSDVPDASPVGRITRPLGKQDFGYWVIRPKGGLVMIEARHNCHFMWDTVTNLGVYGK